MNKPIFFKKKSYLINNLFPDLKFKKNIRMVLDKKSILLADENLDITKDVIKRLNSKLKSIKLN